MQIQVRMEVIHQHQQDEAKDPGGVGFPFEPCQVRRQEFRCDDVFLDLVEAAAVHLPGFAADAAVEPLVGPQAGVQRNEVERGPDPGDAGDDMGPAHHHRDPVEHHVPIDQRVRPHVGQLMLSVRQAAAARPAPSYGWRRARSIASLPRPAGQKCISMPISGVTSSDPGVWVLAPNLCCHSSTARNRSGLCGLLYISVPTSSERRGTVRISV